MRIAIIGAKGIPTHYGGWDAVATELAPRLTARGCDVTVYCQARYSLPERPSSWGGARLVYLPAIQKRALENVSHEAVCMLHALFEGYDVVYVLGLRATVLHSLTAHSRAALVFNTDGHDYRRRKWGRVARRYLEWSEGVGVRLRPHGLISDSAAIADYFVDRYGVRPTFVPYGAPQLPPPDPEPVLRRGLEPGKYLLSVARLEPENNVDKLIEAYAKAEPDMPCVVVGDTNYPSEYVKHIRRVASEGVRFEGFVYDQNELTSLYQHSYAYVHGHEVGGTNPSLLHAMAASSCVLANDVVYNREVLGPTGIYWDSADALAKEIYRVVDDPARAASLRTAAYARVRERYDWESVTDDCLAVFESQRRNRASRRGPG